MYGNLIPRWRRSEIETGSLVVLLIVALALLCIVGTAHATDWRPGYVQNTGCAAAVASGDNGPAASDGNAQCERFEFGTLPTYAYYALGYTAYATPTDLVCLNNTGSNVVRVVQFTLALSSTAVSQAQIYYVKRSAADTGGTPTTLTPTQEDSADAAPGATLVSYAAAPTLGTSQGNVSVVEADTTVASGIPAAFTMRSLLLAQLTASSVLKPVVLHAGEALCANFNGAALPSGFASEIEIEWTESTQ